MPSDPGDNGLVVRKKTPLLLMLLALFGAGVAVLLVWMLLADGVGAGGRAEARGAGEADRSRGGGGGSGKPVVIPTPGDGGGTTSSRIGSAVTSQGRVPYDSPEYLAQVAQDQRRVLELVEVIQGASPKDPAAQVARYRELQELIRSLGHQVNSQVRERLVSLLPQVEEKWRALLGDTLGSFQGDKETARALLGMLQARPENVYTRNAILTALGKIQVNEVVPELLAMLGTGIDNENLIVRTIGQVGGKEAGQALYERLSQPIMPETQREIERVLGEQRDPAILAKIRDELLEGTSDPARRSSYVNILSMARDDAYAPAVRTLLERENDPNVRRYAMQALGKFGDAESGRALLAIVQGGRQDESVEAIRAIHYITNPVTVDALSDEWRTLNDQGRIAVLGAAMRLPSPSDKLLGLAGESIRDPNENIRTSAAQMLGRPGRDASVEPLVAFLARSESLRERATAISALQKVGTLAAAEGALRALGAVPDERQRVAYRATFEKIRDRHLQMQQGR